MDISNIPKGIIGQFYDTSDRTVLSMDAQDDIPIGFPLMRGDDREKQVRRFNGGVSNEMIGVAAYSAQQNTKSYSATYTQSYYPTKSTVSVMHAGKIWIPLYGSQTVNIGDRAYIDTLFDRITNTFVENNTVPVGWFITGGSTADTPLFAIELIPGYTEEVILRSDEQQQPEVLSIFEQRDKEITPESSAKELKETLDVQELVKPTSKNIAKEQIDIQDVLEASPSTEDLNNNKRKK